MSTDAPSVLLCSIPAHAHVTPLLAVASRLIDEGVAVRMLTGSRFRDVVTATGAEFLPLPADADYDDRRLNEEFPGRVGLTGIAQLKYDLAHMFLGAMPGQVAALRAAVAERPTDAVLAEPGFFGAPALALDPRETRPPVVTLSLVPMAAPSLDVAPYGLGIQPLGGPVGRLRNRLLWAVIDKILMRDSRLLTTQTFERLTGHALPGPLFGIPTLADTFVQFTVPAFEYPRSDLRGDVRFVGPMGRITPRTVHGDVVGLPEWWDDLDGHRLVHVTQGTIANADLTELIVPAIRGLAGEDLLVVVATGGRPVESVEEAYGGPLPSNVRVAEYLPYDLLLLRVDAMVTNGGYGGVHAALACGVPLVVSGRTEDKMEVTARVAWSGAGVNLRRQRPKPAAIARGVRRVLGDPSYRENSAAIGRDIAASGGAAEVVALVRELTGSRVGSAG